MRLQAKLAIVLLLLYQPVPAQLVRLGIRAGAPLVEPTFFAQPGYPYGSASSTSHIRFTLGPTVEVRLSKSLSVSVDALYSRFAYDSVGYSQTAFYNIISAQNTVANLWQFPGLLKFKIPVGRFTPYAAAGMSIGHMSDGRTSTGFCYYNFTDPYLAARNNGCRYSDSPATWLDNHTVPGIVVVGGLEFSFGALRLSPEFRYNRWAAEHPGAAPHEWPKAQFLLGITL